MERTHLDPMRHRNGSRFLQEGIDRNSKSRQEMPSATFTDVVHTIGPILRSIDRVTGEQRVSKTFLSFPPQSTCSGLRPWYRGNRARQRLCVKAVSWAC